MISNLGIRTVAQERAAGLPGVFLASSPPPTPEVFLGGGMVLSAAMLCIVAVLCVNTKQNL